MCMTSKLLSKEIYQIEMGHAVVWSLVNTYLETKQKQTYKTKPTILTGHVSH